MYRKTSGKCIQVNKYQLTEVHIHAITVISSNNLLVTIVDNCFCLLCKMLSLNVTKFNVIFIPRILILLIVLLVVFFYISIMHTLKDEYSKVLCYKINTIFIQIKLIN